MPNLYVETQLGAQGRIVIPAELRHSLNFKPGDKLIARQVGESLILERRDIIEQRLLARFSNIPQEVSLVDELIQDRHRAFEKENKK